MKTKERILQQALSLINERGLSQVGVREIARSLEISVGNLSYHFPRKEDLVMELMNRIRQANDALYEDYFAQTASLPAFLIFFRRLMENQYFYRGVLLGNEEVNRIIKTHYDYQSIEQRRREFFHRIIKELEAAGDLVFGPGDIDFLVSFFTLFGRFWLMEAQISFADKAKETIIDHYVHFLEKQLSLFAPSNESPILV